MHIKTKMGAVVFEHDDLYRGEVTITRGDVTVSVSMEALRRIVAESVRVDLADHIAKMKPEQLLRRIT